MKIVSKYTKPLNEIMIEDVTTNHITVAIIDNKPCILGKGWEENMDKLCFYQISSNFTIGNGYSYLNSDNTPEKMIRQAISGKPNKVGVFHQFEWKEALKWLIDNA